MPPVLHDEKLPYHNRLVKSINALSHEEIDVAATLSYDATVVAETLSHDATAVAATHSTMQPNLVAGTILIGYC